MILYANTRGAESQRKSIILNTFEILFASNDKILRVYKLRFDDVRFVLVRERMRTLLSSELYAHDGLFTFILPKSRNSKTYTQMTHFSQLWKIL